MLEERANGTLIRTYAYGHALVSQTQAVVSAGWTTTYYAYDGHGSTRLLTDSAGTITDTYAYDAFGVPIASTTTRAQATFNRYRYCGEQADDDLGLIYLRARYMNPASGRFWSMDTYEGISTDPSSLHKYEYGVSNPIRFIDPAGNDNTLAEMNLAQYAIGALVGIAVIEVYQFSHSIADASGGLSLSDDALGRAVTTLAATSATVMLYSLHDQLEDAKAALGALRNTINRLKVVPVSYTVTPNIAAHIAGVIGKGPDTLTRTTSAQARRNRAAAVGRLGSAGAGLSWDEYPFASTVQGGGGASVKSVPWRENLVQGGIIAASYYLEDIDVGDDFWVILIP